jgi:uncharacterized protein YciI
MGGRPRRLLRVNRWIYLLRATRPAMVDEPTDDELVVLRKHFSYLERLTAEGTCVLAGPSVSPTDTFGLCVLDVEDESTAREIMQADPSIVGGIMTGELRPMRMTFLRGR